MAHRVIMPALEMAQETGKVLAWRKKDGEPISKGEPLLDIETDKTVVEIESPATGILAGVKAHEGQAIPVGQTIAWILVPGENLPAEAATPTIKISPKARRLAQERGIDLKQVRGSGSDGEIFAADILTFAASPAPQAISIATVGATAAMSSIGRLMAEKTVQSWTTVPHFFVVREIDAGALIEARAKLLDAEKSEGSEPRVTHTDLLVCLVARVLRKHSLLNASWSDGKIQISSEVNVAIAIAVAEGVVNVVIPAADTKQLRDLAALRMELSERARAGRSRPSDIIGATFTISNLGMYDVDAFTAIIPPQQSAILAVGRIADRVIAIDRKPVVRPMMTVTLSCDHRVVDGARAAAFLNDFAEAVTAPEKHI